MLSKKRPTLRVMYARLVQALLSGHAQCSEEVGMSGGALWRLCALPQAVLVGEGQTC